MAIRQDFYSPNFEDMGDYNARSLFSSGFEDPQAFMNYEYLAAPPMPAVAPAMAQPAPVQDKDSIINNLTSQIQARSNTSQWSGGYGADKATKDMARILAETGITDISQFGKVDKYEPVEQIGMTLNGQPVQGSGSQLYVLETVDTGDGTDYVRRDLNPEQAAQVQPTYGVVTGTDEYNQPTYRTVEATNVGVKDGQLVGVTGQTFGNKLTGQEVPNTYTTRQTGDFFGGTYEGKGNTGYGVQFDAQGQPIFYTQGASSKDELIKPLTTIGLMALGAYGAESLLGAGAAGGAGATGAGLATTGELGTLAGTAGGTGITAGASGLGLNASGAGLGAAGTGITAGVGLTGTGVLTGSSLGTSLLGTGATVAGLTGTGILSGSQLGSALLGTTPTTPLVGTGVLSGSSLGTELLGTGVGSPVIAPPPIIEPVTSIQPSPVSSGTGITANNSGFGINAGSTGLNTIAVDGGLTGTGILTGSPLGTELLGTGLGVAGLTGTGILAGSELGTGLLGTTSTTPLVGTGVLSGSTLGTELLGTGANTAATVGGVTGLTNAANVGAGALNTGVSTGITGLGSGAVDTGINPSGATTGVVDPTAGVPFVSSNPLSNLTPSQLASLLNGALGLFGALGASQLGGGGGGGSPMNVGALPTQGVPLNSQDYFNAIQQNYNTLLPSMPKDVATPLANWYNSQYTGV